MEPAEVEFLAEKELVTITPNFSENKLCLISGDFGPFNPSMHAEVPLWLAVNLRQRQKCRIEPPSWMDVGVLQMFWLCQADVCVKTLKPSLDTLTQKKREESESAVFTKMPSPHYMEVATLILNTAAEDVPHADEIRALVKDIWDLRIAKLRRSIDIMITQQETYGKLNNLTLMEINTVRPFLTQALDHMHLLRTHAAQYTETPADSVY